MDAETMIALIFISAYQCSSVAILLSGIGWFRVRPLAWPGGIR